MPEQTESSKKPKKRVKNLYLIRLDDTVLQLRRFREENPGYRPRKPCLYVGVTSCNPAARFKQHKAVNKASRTVRKYGKYLPEEEVRASEPSPCS